MTSLIKKTDLSKSSKLPANVVTSVTDIISQVTDYLKVAQVEETKRAEITTRRDCAIAAIQARREILMKAIDCTFQERAFVLQAQLDTLENAVKEGNAAIVAKSLEGMVQVVQSSPFKSIAEVHQLLTSDNSILRLD